MPTPVSAARQCLTEEAARALDDAVAVARRRSHAQTTSLHAVSALIALPSSLLRDACARARSSSYAPRLQFRALDLSVGVSLDRLPSSKAVEEPPVSNSLMAAIKRSQANQRRHPESFHLHQLQQIQQQQQSSTMSLSIVKVELRHFVLSILDDPIVSKVFGEAGFRSYDIKLAILNPPAPPLLPRFPTAAAAPFLGSYPWGDVNLGGGPARGFSFPFSSSSSSSPGPVNGDENCRRIGEVLVKKKGKNPLLIGVCASDALCSFVDFVQKKGKDGVLPAPVSGVKLVCMKKEVSEFIGGGGSEEQLGSKFKELGNLLAEDCSGPGAVISLGELGILVGDGASSDALGHFVSKLTGLLKLHGERLWLIGAAESYEAYSKFLSRFPEIEKEWDLHLLPITSSKTSAIEGHYPKSSLMGSFVPFGGFFSTPSDFKSPLSSVVQSGSRCHLCNEKYEQEVSAILKTGSGISVSDQCAANLPSWLQMAETDKAKDGGPGLSAKLMGLHKKWNDTCQRLHHAKMFSLQPCSKAGQIPIVEDLRLVTDRTPSSSFLLNEDQCTTSIQSAPVEVIGNLLAKQKKPLQVVSEAESTNSLPQLQLGASECQQSSVGTPWFSSRTQPLPSLLPGQTAASSIASVTTDLQLGMQYASKKSIDIERNKNHLQHLPVSVSATRGACTDKTSKDLTQAPSRSGLNVGTQLDPRDLKALWRFLSDKVGWQDEVVSAISQTISLCRSGIRKRQISNLRGDIWLSFLGPDKAGKMRIARALAEILFGNTHSLIYVDLSSQNGFSQSNSIFHCQESNNYDVNFRGKTVVDYMAGEFSKKPHSVVLLDNVDKADFLAQCSLSQAVSTGKFSDSHGRVISINNMIFITTSSMTKGGSSSFFDKRLAEYSEDRILSAKSWQMQILVKSFNEDSWRSTKGMNVYVAQSGEDSNGAPQRKRKLGTDNFLDQDVASEVSKRTERTSKSFLDLNLPVEETQEDVDTGIPDSACGSDNISDPWLSDFYSKVDLEVDFKPFDFDGLAEKVLKEIHSSFQTVMGCEALLEIGREVMVQILAAIWSSDDKRAIDNWIKQVLSGGFAEARQRCSPSQRPLLKLVAREGHAVKERTSGIHLPAQIILN